MRRSRRRWTGGDRDGAEQAQRQGGSGEGGGGLGVPGGGPPPPLAEVAGSWVDGPGVSTPSDGKACWAWCDGAMSQAYSATSLLQVRSFKPVRGGAGLYKRRSRKGNGT